MIDRIYQYSKNLNYCRLCNAYQPSRILSKAQHKFDVNKVFRNAQNVLLKKKSDITDKHNNKDDNKDDPKTECKQNYSTYKNGRLMSYDSYFHLIYFVF